MNVNVSALWSAVRYVVVAIGAFVVGLGWASADDWSALMGQLDTIVAAIGTIVVGAAGVWSRVQLIVQAVNK